MRKTVLALSLVAAAVVLIAGGVAIGANALRPSDDGLPGLERTMAAPQSGTDYPDEGTGVGGSTCDMAAQLMSILEDSTIPVYEVEEYAALVESTASQEGNWQVSSNVRWFFRRDYTWGPSYMSIIGAYRNDGGYRVSIIDRIAQVCGIPAARPLAERQAMTSHVGKCVQVSEIEWDC